MNKLLKIIISLTLVGNLCFSSSVIAKDLCNPQETVMFGYFNGMNTKKDEAIFAQGVFKKIYGEQTPFPQEDKLVYEVFYNQTQGKVKDVIEIYEQRFIEKNPELFAGRYEFIHEVQEGGGDMIKALQEYEEKVLKPKYGDKYQQKLQELDKQAQEIAKDMAIAKMLDEQGKLFKPDYSDNKNYQEYAKHRNKIFFHLSENHKLLFVAYSQGNLFANAAYDYANSKLNHPQQLQVIHIAPASQVLNGDHVLSSKDIMIKWLLNKFKETVTSTDINSFSIFNPMGHALIPTYLNSTQPTSKRIDDYINTAFANLKTSINKQTQAFFTIDFAYDGKNMNFVLTEPNGTKVYQHNQASKSGYLTVNKTSNKGNIQYLASCESNNLQAGSYKIQIKEPATLLRNYAKLELTSYLNEKDWVHLNDHTAIKQNGVTTWNYTIKLAHDVPKNQYSYTSNLTSNSKNKVRAISKP